ncbi:hypothetical protein ACLMJK_008737 [Lecanora helva]
MTEDSVSAPPNLGSNLLAAARTHEKRRPLPAGSGSALIDENALDGGFRYGEITSIAGKTGTGKTLMTYHAIASHLITSEGGEVALIDTTGSFSPLRLRDVLAFRLEARRQRDNYRHSGYMYESNQSKEAGESDELSDQATSMLDRVKVMRVFDFAGVVEAVGEVREMIEQSYLSAEKSEHARAARKHEIQDSEEELDDDNDDDDNEEGEPSRKAALNLQEPAVRGIGMIIVDTIANVVNSVMSKSQVQGQALLASFMRSFQYLVARSHICAILVNAVVGVNSTKNSDYRTYADEHASVFSSTLGKPALGKSFSYTIDTSILMSVVPKTSADATIEMGDRPGLPYEKALVIEILKDRYGAREGRWVAFQIDGGIKLVPCP